MTTFQSRLKSILDEKKMLQKDLARLCNTSAMSISRYINGTREPTMFALASMSRALGVSADYLLGNSDVKNPKIDISAEQRILLAAYGRLSERDRGIVNNILQDYLEPAERAYIEASEKKRDLVAIG